MNGLIASGRRRTARRTRAARLSARAALLGLGILWWWAAARLLLTPDAGVLEATVAAGSWGLSLLPVHCVPKGRTKGGLADGRWRRAWRTASGPPEAGAPTAVASSGTGTAASPRPRSGGESGLW
ncbi:hypothetical protein SAMN05216505_10814 [Streptomyces prasinopilosus]|uniref:Uncharacterized protein n=1 Tax=Streptomyces prasinopilosus TaxID=67344 RepID=A0A1G6UXM7_9ACTN|nr:hypothetical protein [Streptomyces prasinopilosus]SDD46011.1 hypothetical protein SAMN05216505_10814 [Streptomyces prasinopilosus]